MSAATPYAAPGAGAEPAEVGTTIVIPTVARPTLDRLVQALRHQARPVDAKVVVVDDRVDGPPLEPAALDPDGELELEVVRSGGGGPAHARNVGWRRARTPWVSFLDDDVVPDHGWYEQLLADLETAEHTGRVGSQGRIVVPLPAGRRPTDVERGTAGLARSWWITADMSYRRDALATVGGFDERFTRAFREDADIALRMNADHGTIARGVRRTAHPVRPADLWASVRAQAGNADDRLMRRVHGPDWRRRAHAPLGRIPGHLAVTAAAVVGLGALAARRPGIAAVGGAGWLLGTAEFAWSRIKPGPRDPDEVRRMVLTSAAIPPVATYHFLAGSVRHARARPWAGLPDAVLFDRDGTLIHDVPYNGDPEKVEPVEQARPVLDRLRAAGVRLAVVTNQSGVGSGLIRPEDVDAVNRRVDELLGPFDGFYVCPHARDDGCDCRKPAPGLVHRAIADLGARPERTVLVGDIGSDVEAALQAGARGVLVPTPQTRAEEVAAAPHVAPDLHAAVDRILGGRW